MTSKTCTFDSCARPLLCKGLCKLHYDRARVHGTPHWRPPTDSEPFWAKVHKTASTDCWLWTGAVSADTGYGRFYVGRRMALAHRWVYEDATGVSPPESSGPDRLVIDHTCHNDSGCPGGAGCLHRRCVRPDHLEVVRNSVNIARGEATRLQTSCHAGHPLSGDNVYTSPKGVRFCRECGRRRTREWAHRNGSDAA